ncbi:hypothetical protein SKAU_G00108550 [Synaphobranchus kaupii]|uniref:Helicase ARIP4 n=1 Tax=Synaphobranchus kaupii TaxID=118154 RepID=A0A9Q1G080_SYNKA|nr:hypothetical protein SKAU_G00108550 [Synaphobranchus kaupii]
MSEEANSGSDMELDLEEEDLEEEEEEEEEEEMEDDENDGDDEDEAPDQPQGTPFSAENEAQGGDSSGWQCTPPSTSPSGEPPSRPSSRPPSRPDSHSASASPSPSPSPIPPGASMKRASKPAHMRRNIRKLLREHQLEAVTKAAQQEELERRKRLEQQRKDFPVPHLPEFPPVVLASGEISQSSSAHVARQEVICLDSSNSSASEDDTKESPADAIKDDVIELSSGEDDTLHSGQSIQDDDDDRATPGTEESSGSHINDALNQPDALGQVLVNINHPANEKDLFLTPQLARAVKPHQIGGIRFLYDNLVESLERYGNSSGFGCILAHSMGLGKTLQVISFIDILLRHTEAHTVLAIVPVNTLQNWLAEFNLWLPPQEALPQDNDPDAFTPRAFKVLILNDEHKTTAARAKVVAEWSAEGGVLLMGYEMYRLLSLKKSFVAGRKKKSKKPTGPVIIDLDEEDRQQELLKGIEKALSRPGPDVVICDEGHRIKNCHASTSQTLKNIRSRRRVVLTGYPLQNNLIEYWCMVDFVRPDFLGTRQEFSNMFERPILNGQCIDSTPQDVRLMRYRSHVLHSLLEGFVQRRGHDVLRTHLPSKEEHVILVRLSPVQRALYTQFMTRFREAGNSGWLGLNPLKAFCVCCKIWNHPDVLYEALQKENLANEQDLDLDDLTTAGNNRCTAPNLKGAASANSKFIAGLNLGTLQERANQVITYEWAKDIMSNYQTGILENSAKMLLLFHLIDESVRKGDKILVFSQSLSTLSVIEEFLAKRPVPSGRGGADGQGQNWVRNINYYRLDGSTSTSERERLINQFNDPGNSSAWVFLLSTRAGCLGVNLIGANRVVVFDASWNPCHDAQAVCRVYRYGQRKACHIYRLVCDFTLEKKIYDRQISKQGMSDRVVDDLNPVLNFTRREVESLLHFVEEEPDPEGLNTDCKSEMEDVILQACNLYPQLITKQPFHHESLLMDRKEMKLTKAEKKAAKKSYEDEKRASVPYTRPSYAHYYPASDQSLTNIPAFSQRNWRPPPRPDEKPVASVRPVQSTPIPMMPRQVPLGPGASLASSSTGVNFPVNYLQKAGVFVQKIVTTTDIVIPGTNSSADVQARISAGESIHVIRGTKGTYIRTSDGRIFAIRAAGKSRPGEESSSTPRDTPRSSEGTPSNGSNGCSSPDRKRLTPDSLARPLSPDGPEILSELRRYTAGASELAAGGQERALDSGSAKGEGAGRPGGDTATALDLRGTKRKLSSTPSSEERRPKQPAGKRTSMALPLQGLPLSAGYSLPPVGLSPALLGSMGHPMFMGAGSPYFQPHGQLGDPRLMFPVTPDPFCLGSSGLPGSSSSGPSSSSASVPSSSSPSAAGSASGSLPPFMFGSSMAGMLPPGFPLSYGQSLMPEPRMYPASLLPGGLPATPGPAGSSFLSHFSSPSLLGAALRRANARAVSENGGSSSDDDVIETTETVKGTEHERLDESVDLWNVGLPVAALHSTITDFTARRPNHRRRWPLAEAGVLVCSFPRPLGAFLDELDTLLSSFPEDVPIACHPQGPTITPLPESRRDLYWVLYVKERISACSRSSRLRTSTSVVVKAICAAVLLLYLLSWALDTVYVLGVTPGYLFPPNFWIWTLVTHVVVEQHLVDVVVSLATMIAAGRLLEPLWGALELLIFFAVVNVSVGLLAGFSYLLTYVATFNLDYLFAVRVHGMLGFLGGVLVALKQTMGDLTVLHVPQVRLKVAPMLVLLALAVLRLTTLVETTAPLAAYGYGVLAGWPAVGLVAGLVHSILVKIKVCRKMVKRYDVGAPSSITISLPGTDPQDAERRRWVSARAAQRLGRSVRSENPPPTRERPPIAAPTGHRPCSDLVGPGIGPPILEAQPHRQVNEKESLNQSSDRERESEQTQQLALKALNERLKRVEDQSAWPSMDDEEDEDEDEIRADVPLLSGRETTSPAGGASSSKSPAGQESTSNRPPADRPPHCCSEERSLWDSVAKFCTLRFLLAESTAVSLFDPSLLCALSTQTPLYYVPYPSLLCALAQDGGVLPDGGSRGHQAYALGLGLGLDLDRGPPQASGCPEPPVPRGEPRYWSEVSPPGRPLPTHVADVENGAPANSTIFPPCCWWNSKSSVFFSVLYSKGADYEGIMITTPPSPAPAFFRISDRDLTEIELHSVESINDLHRTHSEQLHKGSRQLHPQGPPSNGNLQFYGMPVICQTGYSRRRRWYKWLCGCCKSTVCRYTWGCAAVSLVLVTLFVIFFFLIQQGGALKKLYRVVQERQAASLEISQLIQDPAVIAQAAECRVELGGVEGGVRGGKLMQRVSGVVVPTGTSPYHSSGPQSSALPQGVLQSFQDPKSDHEGSITRPSQTVGQVDTGIEGGRLAPQPVQAVIPLCGAAVAMPCIVVARLLLVVVGAAWEPIEAPPSGRLQSDTQLEGGEQELPGTPVELLARQLLVPPLLTKVPFPEGAPVLPVDHSQPVERGQQQSFDLRFGFGEVRSQVTPLGDAPVDLSAPLRDVRPGKLLQNLHGDKGSHGPCVLDGLGQHIAQRSVSSMRMRPYPFPRRALETTTDSTKRLLPRPTTRDNLAWPSSSSSLPVPWISIRQTGNSWQDFCRAWILAPRLRCHSVLTRSAQASTRSGLRCRGTARTSPSHLWPTRTARVSKTP